MRVRVLFFAGLRELAGNRELYYDLETGATLADLRERIRADLPGFREREKALRWAVGEEYAPLDRPLSEGESVALIPPVSGG